MTISIIIPAKNEANNLEKLLPALERQSTPPIEVLVANAPSTTDKTNTVATRYGARVIEGGLPGVGRNAGGREAKGEFLVFLDADTMPATYTFLEDAQREMQQRGLGVASVDNVPRTNDFAHRGFYHLIQNPLVRLASYTRRPYAIGTCIIARRSTHHAIGGFDERIAFAEDVEYVQRAVDDGYAFGILSPTTSVLTSARRLEKDGVFGVCVMAIRGEIERRLRKRQITDIAKIDPEYFTHE